MFYYPCEINYLGKNSCAKFSLVDLIFTKGVNSMYYNNRKIDSLGTTLDNL